MEFFRARGFDIVGITRALGKEVPELDNVQAFLEAGYVRLGDFLAKGNLVPRDFEKSQLLAYVFRRQGLDPARPFNNPIGVSNAPLGGPPGPPAPPRTHHNLSPPPPP